jgi:hypothetical protein
MKRIILALLLSGIFISTKAQTEIGDWLVGGRIDINAVDQNTLLSFSPSAGIFFAHNFAAGGQLMLSYLKSGGAKTTAFGIGPFVRYYFTNSNVKPLLQASIGYQTQKVTVSGISGTNSYASFFLGGGVAVFINENVSLEPIMGYTNNDGTGGFNFGMGFQVYLSKRQVEKVRGK